MKVGRVIGNIWATRKEDKLAGLKLMIVQPVSLTTGEAYGTPLVASDVIGAGVGERVLYVNGSSARTASGGPDIPVDAAIVGIVDDHEILE